MVTPDNQLGGEKLWEFRIFLRLGNIFGGIYLWEFFTTLCYEWEVIRGRRSYRWTIWIYSISRLATLIAVITNIIANNLNTISCQIMVSLGFILSNTALALVSLLILVRIAAIWNLNKLVLTIAAGVWITNVIFIILGATRIHSTWVPKEHFCSPVNTESRKPTLISTLSSDIALLLIMLVGLFRLRRRGGGWFDIGHLLWKQGILWLSLALIAELIPVVFMCLNLNVVYDMMFLMPTLCTMTIAATRTYRSLSDFRSPTEVQKCSENFQRVPRSPQYADFAIDSISRVEVAVHTTHEQYVTSPKGECVSLVSTERLSNKTGELDLDEIAECNV